MPELRREELVSAEFTELAVPETLLEPSSEELVPTELDELLTVWILLEVDNGADPTDVG